MCSPLPRGSVKPLRTREVRLVLATKPAKHHSRQHRCTNSSAVAAAPRQRRGVQEMVRLLRRGWSWVTEGPRYLLKPETCLICGLCIATHTFITRYNCSCIRRACTGKRHTHLHTAAPMMVAATARHRPCPHLGRGLCSAMHPQSKGGAGL